jgi:hypothetical protein
LTKGAQIDWMLLATIASPLLAVLLGAWLNHIITGRPRLLSYLVHASAITTRRQPGGVEPMTVFTHSIVVRNTSRQNANNVRLGHCVLPDFTIYPSISYQVVQLPDGSMEILIPKLVRSEQVTVSYLYFPPITWDKINLYTKSDEGFAKIVSVLPTPPAPRSLVLAVWSLAFIGFCVLAYAAVRLVGQWW